jgi:hypothetical protein
LFFFHWMTQSWACLKIVPIHQDSFIS